MTAASGVTGTRLRVLGKSEVKILGIIYERNGRLCHAWPVPLNRLEALGLRNGECTCGDANFCDSINGVSVRPYQVGTQRCSRSSAIGGCETQFGLGLEE